jgi:hypothetical protein
MNPMRSFVAMAGLFVVSAAGCQNYEGTPGVDYTDRRNANRIPTGNGAGDAAGQVVSPQERERIDRIKSGEYEPRPRNSAVNASDAGDAPRDNVKGVGGSGADPRGQDLGNSGTTTTPDRTAPAGR